MNWFRRMLGRHTAYPTLQLAHHPAAGNEDEGLPSEVVLQSLPATFGRGERADVRVDDLWMSRVHCEMYNEDGALAVRDLGSRHGLVVNGVQVKQALLSQGDQVRMGLTTFIAKQVGALADCEQSA